MSVSLNKEIDICNSDALLGGLDQNLDEKKLHRMITRAITSYFISTVTSFPPYKCVKQ